MSEIVPTSFFAGPRALIAARARNREIEANFIGGGAIVILRNRTQFPRPRDKIRAFRYVLPPMILALPIALVLAAIDFQSPLTWAILIGWIMSVVLHEFAHGLVAHLGGDYTIKERGGLTLNPLQYVDPVMSLALPAIILAIGGIPLPGGVTYIRRDLLRSRAWEAAVSAAGPAMNFLLFIALSLPFHPALGWVDTHAPASDYQTWQIFLAAMAQLQMIAVILNLVPIPPLDGFNLISPWLPTDLREKLSTPPISTIAFLVFFLVLWRSPAPIRAIYELTMRIQLWMGFDVDAMVMMARCYNIALFGSG